MVLSSNTTIIGGQNIHQALDPANQTAVGYITNLRNKLVNDTAAKNALDLTNTLLGTTKVAINAHSEMLSFVVADQAADNVKSLKDEIISKVDIDGTGEKDVIGGEDKTLVGNLYGNVYGNFNGNIAVGISDNLASYGLSDNLEDSLLFGLKQKVEWIMLKLVKKLQYTVNFQNFT